MDDRDLIARAARGQTAAFHHLVDQHAPRLFRLAMSLLGNHADAEDVLQETLTGAFRGLKDFESRSTVKTWLTRILMNQVALFRRRQRRIEPLEEIATEGATNAASAKMDVHAALESLSDENRQIIVLRELERMSYEEIAQTLDIPRGTVESRLHRARKQLREKLKSYGM